MPYSTLARRGGGPVVGLVTPAASVSCGAGSTLEEISDFGGPILSGALLRSRFRSVSASVAGRDLIEFKPV